MDEALRILHFLGLALGLGGGVANAVVAAKVTRTAPALGGPAQKLIGRIGFLGILLLWASGAALALGTYGLAALPVLFWLKMIAVLLLTALAVTAQVAVLRRPPPDPARMARLGQGMILAALLSMILAVLAFG